MAHKVCAFIDVIEERLNCFVSITTCLHLGVVCNDGIEGQLIIYAEKLVNDDALCTLFIHDPILAKKNVVVFFDALQE